MSRKRTRRSLPAGAAALVLGALLPLLASSALAQTTEYQLLVSFSPDRSSAVSLQGQTLGGNIYVFTSPDTGASRVRFYLDDPTMAGTPRLIEKLAPFDFAGTASDDTAKPFDTKKISEGSHTITAAIERSGSAEEVLHGTFTVEQLPELTFLPTSLSFSRREDASAVSQTVELTADDGSAASTTVSTDAAWLTATAAGPTPTDVTVTADPATLPIGTHTGKVTASAAGYVSTSLPVSFKVTSADWCSDISPLPCSEVLVRFPYQLDFGSDAGKLNDANLIGTGFTMIDPATNGTGYIPANLSVDAQAGALGITTTKGIASGAVNSQDNALGVGIDAPDSVPLLTTTLVAPPAGTGKYEQAGLWFGNDEDNHVKLVVRSTSKGTDIQYLLEVDGKQKNSIATDALPVAGSNVQLSLRADPATAGVTGTYSIDGGDPVRVGIFRVPGEFFSADAAGIDPTIGTRTFGGILATHRNGSSPLTYTFDDFSLIDDSSGTAGGVASAFSFDRTSFPLTRPTSMAWGPDGRLYVTELLGTIHALTLGPDNQPVADEVITTLGARLTLGIAVDPASTPSNVILWASHSDRNLSNDAPPNSSMVSRLSGPGFTTRQDVITGLPRSMANHSVNSLHFGPEGRLYVAISGNTGAGAPNTADTEFGDRAEQPLSAAILVADVGSPDFQGDCETPLDTFGFPETCDVRPYATGFRNSYDFTFHSNGSMYATDNGLGVTGSFPPSPNPPCTGLASTEPWNEGGNNPGEQPDLLFRVEAGKYYGHPNPYRDECVFKDGRYQDVAPLPNYEPPLFALGSKKSANGVIEYRGDAFKGVLQGDLLITNYSQGDDVVRVKLSPDGLSVADFDVVAGGFSDPLTLIEGADGTIFVAEFGSSQITALTPRSTGRWETRAPLPDAILDAGGTALDGKLYVVGGKTSSGHLKTLHVYDAASDSWSVGPGLPAAYAAVENPAVVALDGKLYVFGGSTDAFSGAVASAAVFDPAMSEWTMLSSMQTARGGAAAEEIGGKIYVVGGMDGAGASLASVEVYDPATDTWSTAAPMQTRRDNPGIAAIDGKLYLFGGRTRNADGTTLNGTLSSVEMYDPTTDAWTSRAPMPTGRRTMAVGVLEDRVQVMGGERTSDGGAFPQNEEYDPVANIWRTLEPMPTPRHGAVSGVIDGFVYVAGGGPIAGSSFTNVNEAFTFEGS
ncbi:MAG: Kelch repeat-containing protein [Gaiellaceae bacterium]